jgi:hypothetical protein
MPSRTKAHPATTAKLLVVLLAFAWGLNWVAAAIALREMSPWSLRVAGSGIGAATLFAAAILSGHSLKVPRGEYIHIMIAGLFNVAGFQILSGFAQSSGATTRAIIITYSMPIWTTVRVVSCAGRTTECNSLVRLRIVHRRFDSFVVAIICARVSSRILLARLRIERTFATVYIKWAKVTVEPLTNASWQLLLSHIHHCRLVPVRRSPASLADEK